MVNMTLVQYIYGQPHLQTIETRLKKMTELYITNSGAKERKCLMLEVVKSKHAQKDHPRHVEKGRFDIFRGQES